MSALICPNCGSEPLCRMSVGEKLRRGISRGRDVKGYIRIYCDCTEVQTMHGGARAKGIWLEKTRIRAEANP